MLNVFDVLGYIFMSIRNFCNTLVIPGMAPFTVWHVFVAGIVSSVIILLWQHLYTFGNK